MVTQIRNIVVKGKMRLDEMKSMWPKNVENLLFSKKSYGNVIVDLQSLFNRFRKIAVENYLATDENYLTAQIP